MSEPASASTNTQICNLALARLGQPAITTIEGDDLAWVEELMALHYPQTRRRLLRGGTWNFAKERAAVTAASGVTPAFGFGNAFALPVDYLRFLTLGNIDEDNPLLPTLYDIRGRYIYTDETDDSDTIYLSYIKDETNVAVWDALFQNLARLELASDVCYRFTLKPSQLTALADELKDVRLEAKAVAGQETPPKRVTRSKWAMARRLGGSSRDTTRYSI